VLLDASAIIYLLEGDTAAQGVVQRTLSTLPTAEQKPQLAVSALSRLECRVRPLREGERNLLDRYAAFFDDPGLVVIPLDTEVLERAAGLRASYRLRTPDAIQAASLLASEPNGHFVTGDSDFHRVPGLDVRQVAAGGPR